MAIRVSTLATLAILTTIGSATAGERTDITPPLYREYARSTPAVRPAAEMTTIPSLVRTAPEAPHRIIEATAR